ncbi:hypothetical protein [Aquimarina aquimarini]|uniref:hypothetical protein n=1 Tax=Aquimarina aquimarini TaxID=1191734 RepID=UPI000D551014|nr:hypothetical protein [Aquimarina aquimarini]
MKLKSIFLILVTSIILCSCNSDDSAGPIEFDANAKLEIVKVNATSIDVNYETNSFFNLAIGIRKEGETEFGLQTQYDTNNITRDNLEPAQKYEMTLLVSGSDELKFDIIKFTTLPFDKANGLLDYVYSERGLTHEIEPNVYNADASIKFYLIGESDPNIKIELPYTFTNGKIKFVTPENTLSDTPYQEYQNYNVGYQIEEAPISLLTFSRHSEVNNIVISVFNKKPYIQSITENKRTSCQNVSMYSLRFKGAFFSHYDDSIYNFEQTKAVITRIDDGSEFILDEGSNGCTQYMRLEGNFELPNGVSKIHTNSGVWIKYPKSTLPNAMFTAGDYKIKFVFSNQGNGVDDFYETNEFPFTLD